MASDINTRITIAVDSSAAQQAIRGVTTELERLIAAREKYLQLVEKGVKHDPISEKAGKIQENAVQYDRLNDVISSLSAQFSKLSTHLSTISAKISENNAEVNKLRDNVSSIPQAVNSMSEALSNLGKKDSSGVENKVSESSDKATKSTQKLTFAQIAARAAGRALGIELSGTSTAMIQLGIVGAGAAAAVKLVKFAYDNWREGLAEAADLEHRNSESILESTERLAGRIEKEKEALQTIDELAGKQNRTVDETVKLSRATRLLGGDFAKLAKSANLANGEIADFSHISEAAAKKQYAAKLRQLQATYNQLSAEEETQVTRRDTAGIPVWFGGDLRLGGEDEAKEAQEKINELAEKRLEIQRKINELKQSETERLKDQEVKEKAIVTVSNKNIDRRLMDLENQRKIQDLINSGKEREAEILKIRNQLDKEALKLQGKELEIFNSRRGEIEKSMLKSYDQKAEKDRLKAAERAEKDRLKAAERAEKDRLKAAERAEKDRLKLIDRGIKEEEKAYKSLRERLFTYRETAQKAITSDSLEGIALQSRVFMNTSVSMAENPAKDTAANTKKMLTELSAMKSKIHNLKTALTSNGIRISGLSTHKY